MDGYSVKKSPFMQEWMAQADPPKSWMVDRYSSLQIKWRTTLNNGQLQVVFWKKYCL